MAKELKIEPNTAPDPSLPKALQLFPERLVALGEKHQLDRKKIAAYAGRDAAQVGRWLGYKQLKDLAARVVISLEDNFGLPPGTLLLPHSIELGQTVTLSGISRTGDAMGMSSSVVCALLDGTGGERMSEYGIGLRRAILGAVHLLGLPLETVLDAAEKAKAQVGATDMEPEAWLGQMRPFLKDKKLESGSYPSYSSIKNG